MITTQMKNLSLFKVLAILSVMILPIENHLTAYAKTGTPQGTVTAANLNVRADADIASEIIGLVHQGDKFEIIQTKNSWDQIKLLSNQTGWVYNAYIKTPAENIEATVKAGILNVRENPSISSRIVDKLKWGTKIILHEEQAGWAKIVSPSGVQGWVYEYYIKKDARSNHPNSATQAAKTTTGKIAVDNHPIDKKSESQSKKSSRTSDEHMTTLSVENSQEPLKGKTIVLDPGHGGIDIGTTSIVGTHEKTLNLATAKVVEQKLVKAGADVIMTRTNDTYISLQQRSALSNQNDADAFISFHYNWSNDSSVHGLTDFYFQKSKDNTLASDILKEVVKATGVNNVGTRFGNLYVLRNNPQPSTLIELGFLSNKQDVSVVESSTYRDNVAEGVYLGLLDYFSIEK